MAKVPTEYVILQSLKRDQRVGVAKQHHQELKVPMVSSEGRLRNVVEVHANLVVLRA